MFWGLGITLVRFLLWGRWVLKDGRYLREAVECRESGRWLRLVRQGPNTSRDILFVLQATKLQVWFSACPHTWNASIYIYIYKFIKKTQCFCWSGWWLKNLVHEFPTRLISLRTKMNNIHRIIHKSSFRRAWTYASSPTNGVSAMPLLKFPCGKNAKRSDRMWPRFDGCHSALERTLQYEGTAIAKPPAKQVMLMRCCTYLPTTLLLYGRHHEWNIS